MSEQKHEPAMSLRYWPETKTITGGEYQIALFTVDPQGGAEDVDALMRRIVACVNACEGISTSYLEELASSDGIKEHLSAHQQKTTRLLLQRDALADTLQSFVDAFGELVDTDADIDGGDAVEYIAAYLKDARAALAECHQ